MLRWLEQRILAGFNGDQGIKGYNDLNFKKPYFFLSSVKL